MYKSSRTADRVTREASVRPRKEIIMRKEQREKRERSKSVRGYKKRKITSLWEKNLP